MAYVAEPEIVVEHREHLWYVLAEAAQVEHHTRGDKAL